MSRMRILGFVVLSAALLLGTSACSSDGEAATKNDRPPIAFAEPPKGSTDLGLCNAYNLEQVKELIGGDETFKRLAPAAIGATGDAVRGEACGWQRTEPNGDALNLRIEVRNFGEDGAALLAQLAALEEGTIDATSVEDIGDEAFAAVTPQTSLLQIASGPYLMTLSSRADGTLQPVALDALKLLGVSGLDQIQ